MEHDQVGPQVEVLRADRLQQQERSRVVEVVTPDERVIQESNGSRTGGIQQAYSSHTAPAGTK